MKELIMPFEYDDTKVKTILVMIRRRDGTLKYSGMLRHHYESEESSIRLQSAIDNSMIFDEIHWITEDIGEDSEFSFIGFDPDWDTETANE